MALAFVAAAASNLAAPAAAAGVMLPHTSALLQAAAMLAGLIHLRWCQDPCNFPVSICHSASHLARAYAQQVAHALRLAAEQPGAIIALRLCLQERVDAGHDAAACGAVLLLVEAEHQGWRRVLPPALELAAAQARVELCYIHRQVQVAALDLLVQVQQLQLQLAAVFRLWGLLRQLRQLLVVLLVQLLLLLIIGVLREVGGVEGVGVVGAVVRSRYGPALACAIMCEWDICTCCLQEQAGLQAGWQCLLAWWSMWHAQSRV